jgi:polyferredoxin
MVHWHQVQSWAQEFNYGRAVINMYETKFVVLAAVGGNVMGWIFVLYFIILLRSRYYFDKKEERMYGTKKFLWQLLHVIVGLAGTAGSFVFIISPLLVLPNLKRFPSYINIYTVSFILGLGINAYMHRDEFLVKKDEK